jgi:aminoglycoside phosphotransferase (APT) family kinase protein
MNLAPRDPEDWLRQMAAALPRLHDVPRDADPFEMWVSRADLRVPSWAQRPDTWARAIELFHVGPAPYEPRFIHHDYQHFNLLWSREQLTGIVDWVEASSGPPDVDVGHCRLNLAVLYDADRADRFLAAYQAEAGRKVDPWWDMASLLVYLPGWDSFIQSAGRPARDA